MHSFVRNLITEWRELGLPTEGETIVTAVSGGADSISLLLALGDLRGRRKLDLRIVAAHFNHKLRARESDEDEEFVKQITTKHGFELAVAHGPISKDGNLEQNARLARYEFLRSTAENLKAGWVLTAHTMNDQAETFLLNLIRGSGLDGLSGMRTIRTLNAEHDLRNADSADSAIRIPHSAVKLARPLLSWAKREDNENFCRGSGINFRYDTMNDDLTFKRVRVRKMLLPMLKEFNPKIIETLANTAELISFEAHSAGAAEGPPARVDPEEIPEMLLLSEIQSLDSMALKQTLRSWIKFRRGSLRSIGLKHIEAVECLVHSKMSGRMVELPGFGLVRKRNGQLSFENIRVDK